VLASPLFGVGYFCHGVIDQWRDINLHVGKHGHGTDLVVQNLQRVSLPQAVVSNAANDAPNALHGAFCNEFCGAGVFSLPQFVFVGLGHVGGNADVNSE
jgi:hypothetical protein